ncbi:hypothetical protein ZIOFF_029505 [Zingiber officinale]|uniref:Uncharacterized protein n=1 Tax=Zingiber officinale TaxID=94328 RepID=A0A8J5LEG1_ZINOF|nr:hypothetical protein ZIOFF_029505 [Zingiber officinale]
MQSSVGDVAETLLEIAGWKGERGREERNGEENKKRDEVKELTMLEAQALDRTGLDSMSPRRVYQRRRENGRDGGETEEERHAAPDPPCPLPDATTRILEGMARLLEQHTGNAHMGRQEDVYVQFRRMDPKDFVGTTDPFVAKGVDPILGGDIPIHGYG